MSAFEAFATGFLKGETDEIRTAQKKDAASAEKLEASLYAMKVEGQKQRVAAHNDRAKGMSEIKALQSHDPTLAMRRFIEMNGGNWQTVVDQRDNERKNAEANGKTVNLDWDTEYFKKKLNEEHDRFADTPAPTYKMDTEVDLKYRNARDKHALGGFLRDMFGVRDDSSPLTPYSAASKVVHDMEQDKMAYATETAQRAESSLPTQKMYTRKEGKGGGAGEWKDYKVRNNDGSETVTRARPYNDGFVIKEGGEEKFVTTLGTKPERLTEVRDKKTDDYIDIVVHDYTEGMKDTDEKKAEVIKSLLGSKPEGKTKGHGRLLSEFKGWIDEQISDGIPPKDATDKALGHINRLYNWGAFEMKDIEGSVFTGDSAHVRPEALETYRAILKLERAAEANPEQADILFQKAMKLKRSIKGS